MKEPLEYYQLIRANLLLAEATNKIASTNKEAIAINYESIKIIKAQIENGAQTKQYLKEQYQALSDKSQRSIQEESWYSYLKKLLEK